jgi:hypothetical protein
MLDGHVSAHSLLRCLLLCHVSQVMVRHDSVDWVVFLVGWLDFWVYPRASDLFIARELVNGEADVWCGVLTWCRDIGLGVHGEPRLGAPCLL